jgi:hypothetical protein
VLGVQIPDSECLGERFVLVGILRPSISRDKADSCGGAAYGVTSSCTGKRCGPARSRRAEYRGPAKTKLAGPLPQAYRKGGEMTTRTKLAAAAALLFAAAAVTGAVAAADYKVTSSCTGKR